MPVLLGAGNRPGNRMEDVQHDVSMGEYSEGTRGDSRGKGDLVAEDGRLKRRPYAVANITRGTVTFLCADNARDAISRVRVNDTDMVWYTTRIRRGPTHLHTGSGVCVPKVYSVRAASSKLSP